MIKHYSLQQLNDFSNKYKFEHTQCENITYKIRLEQNN